MSKYQYDEPITQEYYDSLSYAMRYRYRTKYPELLRNVEVTKWKRREEEENKKEIKNKKQNNKVSNKTKEDNKKEVIKIKKKEVKNNDEQGYILTDEDIEQITNLLKSKKNLIINKEKNIKELKSSEELDDKYKNLEKINIEQKNNLEGLEKEINGLKSEIEEITKNKEIWKNLSDKQQEEINV